MKKLHIEHLRSRRKFLKDALRKGVTPAVVVYSIHKTLPPLFGRSGP